MARYKGQFVPLKVTTSGADWGKWARKHGTPGNAIPMIYVVRADGELLFSGVGSMPGQELFTMLKKVTSEMGVLLNDQQLAAIETGISDLDESAEDLPATMKIISDLNKKKLIVDADCFAKSYSALQEKVDSVLKTHFDGTLDGCLSAYRLQQAMSIEQNRVRAIRNYVTGLGDDPNDKMVSFGWDLMLSTKIKWSSAGGDDMAGTLVSLEGEGDGARPEEIVLKRLDGRQVGPLPLTKFSDDSRRLANAMSSLQQLNLAIGAEESTEGFD